MLAGKRAFISGASRGMGKNISVALAELGCDVVLHARDIKTLKDTAESCKKFNVNVTQMAANFADMKEVDELAQKLNDEHSIDILVNNAGMLARGTINGELSDWDRMMNVNLNAPMHLTRILAPRMSEEKYGIIVNIGSIAAVEPMKSVGAYAASKYGLRGFSLSCYEALRHDGVKVCLINPAYVNTPMVQGNENLDYKVMIQPEDIAETVRFIANTSVGCVPQEITLRLSYSAYKQK